MRRLLLALLLLLPLLMACTPAVPDCGMTLYRRPTVTPRISPPTATPDPLATTTPAPTGTPCPTATTPPTRAPVFPTRPPSRPGMGTYGGRVRAVAAGGGNETAVAAAGGEGTAALVYRDEDIGQLVVVTSGDGTRIPVGAGSIATLAFGPDQVAVVKRGGGQLVLRIAPSLPALATSLDALVLPWSGQDLEAGYGPEGWLYVASGGLAQRLNPVSGEWESSLLYAGAARELVRTAAGALLLHTSAGVYCRDVATGQWAQVWSGQADGMAVLDERVALAWQESNTWRVVESADSGLTWSAPQTAAGGLPGGYGPAYPILAADGYLEVVGLYTEPARGDGSARYTYPMLAHRDAQGWFPAFGDHPEPLVAQTGSLRPARHLMAVSVHGLTLITWEGLQFNGASDVFAITR